MVKEKELERIDQAAGYFERYFEFEDAVTISKENKEYLKTYIHDNDYVVKSFDIKKKCARFIGISALIAAAAFLLLWLMLGSDLIIAVTITAVVIFICAAGFGIALNKYRLTAAENKQVEVNEGINEQILILDDRIKQLERQRDDYYNALGKRVTFMSLEYMRNIEQIKQFLLDGKAQTCEEAVDLFEESLLYQQMTDIMTKSEKIAPVQDDKERFGDPLKIIKENKKKRRKEKKKKN